MRVWLALLVIGAGAIAKPELQMTVTTAPQVHRFAPILVQVAVTNVGDETAWYTPPSELGEPDGLDVQCGDEPWQPFMIQDRIGFWDDCEIRFGVVKLEPQTTRQHRLFLLWDAAQQRILSDRRAGARIAIRLGVRRETRSGETSNYLGQECHTTVLADGWQALNPWPSVEVMRYLQGEHGGLEGRDFALRAELRRLALEQPATIPGRWSDYFLRRKGWNPLFPNDHRLDITVHTGHQFVLADVMRSIEVQTGVPLQTNGLLGSGGSSSRSTEYTVRELMANAELMNVFWRDEPGRKWLVWIPTGDGYRLEQVDPDEHFTVPEA